MIVGEYQNSRNQVSIDLIVIGPYGDSVEVKAVVDTGFSGYLMLPERLVRELRLQVLREQEVVLADGSISLLGRYDAEIEWDGRRRGIPVYASRGEPLVGMKLLRRHLVTLELVPEGSITIERTA